MGLKNICENTLIMRRYIYITLQLMHCRSHSGGSNKARRNDIDTGNYVTGS